ncbi:hypothetical protein ACEPAF_4745 [Sanghuangporus sanghuang]
MRSSRKRRRESSGSIVHPVHAQDGEGVSWSEKEAIEAEVWDAFREEYVESVEQLPLSIHRNFALLKELDAQANVMGAGLLPKIGEYIQHRRHLGDLGPSGTETIDVLHGEHGQTSGRRVTRFNGSAIMIRHDSLKTEARNRAQGRSEHLHYYALLSDFSTCINELVRTAEEKVNLAQATYDSIDRHVRLLDQAIKEHELHLRDDLSMAKINSPSFPIGGLVMTRLKDHVDSPIFLSQHNLQRRPERNTLTHSRGRSRRAVKLHSSSPVQGSLDDNLKGDARYTDKVKAADMPIDPNEPRYCYCGQVSWGEMIACDAAGCEREWFHLNCVGLSEAPKRGKWYCDACKENRSLSRLRRRGH